MFKKSKQEIKDCTITDSTIVQLNNSAVLMPEKTPLLPVYTLPAENSYFTGRIPILRKIKGKFETARSNADSPLVVLTGMGGIGKTSIAYQFAHSLETLVKIRIRTDNFDIIKEDFSEVANLLGINIQEKSLEDIVKLVYQQLDKYQDGIIVFDNVDSYIAPINPVKLKNIRGLFPSGDKFWILVTSRNTQYWPQNAMVPINRLDENDAIEIFKKVSGLTSLNIGKLSIFLHEKLGYSPLAVCQAAAYIKFHGMELDDYIELYNQPNSSIKVLEAIKLLPPELTFDGETPEERQAILTTYNLNIESLESVDFLFVEILRYAALMHPDAIERTELYDIFSKNNPLFKNLQNNFGTEVQKTSLITFEKSVERSREMTLINMHRSIQLVLLLKLHEKSDYQDRIKTIISNLFEYFAKHYLNARTSHANFTYILNNIDKKKLFYKYVEISDTLIIEGMFNVACQYLISNEIDASIYFLSRAIQHVNEMSNPDLYTKIESNLLEVINKFNLINLNQDWISELLRGVKSLVRPKIVDVLLKSEKKLTADKKRGDAYYQTVKSLATAIIETYQNNPNRSQQENEQLAQSYYLLGRTFREEAKGLQTQIEGIKKFISSKEAFMQRNPHTDWPPYQKAAAELAQATSEEELLIQRRDEACEGAKKYLYQAVNLRTKLNQNDEIPTLLSLIQITRLNKIENIENIENIAKAIIKNYDKLEKKYKDTYLEDKQYCEKLVAFESRKRAFKESATIRNTKIKTENSSHTGLFKNKSPSSVHQSSSQSLPNDNARSFPGC